MIILFFVRIAFYASVWCTLLQLGVKSEDNGEKLVFCSLSDHCSYEGKSYGGVTADCKSLHLNSIPPDLPTNITCLYLKNNYISEIKNELNRYKALRVLDLTNNTLEKIDVDAFKELLNLSVLLLNNNALDLSSDIGIPRTLFAQQKHLEVLNIQNNKFNNTSHYRDDFLLSLGSTLRKLCIDGHSGGTAFGKGFSQLLFLKSFHLFGTFDYIGNMTFQVFQNIGIEELYIQSGLLFDVEALAFSHLKALKILVLNDNPNLGFSNITHAWEGLSKTNLEELHLEYTNPIVDKVITLEGSFFTGLNNSGIRKLYLDRNSIVVINNSRFHQCLPNLEVLSLDYNCLELITSLVMDIMWLKHLKYVSASYQIRRYSVHGGFEIEKSIATKYANPTNFHPSKYLWYAIIPPKFQTLILHESLNADISTLPEIYFIGRLDASNVTLDYSGNGIQKLVGPIRYFQTGQKTKVYLTVKINDNGITYLSPNICDPQTLEKLFFVNIDVSNNRLANQVENDEKGAIFSPYSQIRVLNASNNLIKNLPVNITRNLLNLEILNLSINSLRSVNFTISNLRNLRILDLSSNLITYFDKPVRDALDSLSIANHSIEIYLANNPLICSCDTLDFLTWINETNVTFIRYQQYECSFDGSYVTLARLFNDHLHHLRIQCSSKTLVTIASVILGCTFVAVATSVCIYRHRWDIRFFCLQLVNKRKKYQKLEQKDDYLYDAFVAYHVNDVSWVKNVLLPQLETEDTLKLCLHHRDFIPGTVIEENIIENINRSFKVLLILSKNFVTSSWCEFELQMARMRCFDQGRDIIVVIMLEPVPAESMSTTLQALIKRITYIKWPARQEEQPEFWQKVQQVLRAPEVAPLKCECGRYAAQN